MKSAISQSLHDPLAGVLLGTAVGDAVGKQGIPHDWLDNLCDWPRPASFIDRVAEKLAEQMNTQNSLGPLRYFWPGLIPRNMFFLFVILLHGFSRLVPRLPRGEFREL